MASLDANPSSPCRYSLSLPGAVVVTGGVCCARAARSPGCGKRYDAITEKGEKSASPSLRVVPGAWVAQSSESLRLRTATGELHGSLATPYESSYRGPSSASAAQRTISSR